MEKEKSIFKSKKKLITIIITTTLLIIASVAIIFSFKNINNYINENDKNLENVNESDNLSVVKNLLNSYESNIGKEENLVFDTCYDDNYRFFQTYNGVEVYGGGIVTKLENNELTSIINYIYEIPENFNITPLNNENDLLEIAKQYLGYDDLILNDSKLIIYPINVDEFDLAYLYKFDIGNVIISDSNKVVLASTTALNTSTSQEITQQYYTHLFEQNKENAKKFMQSDGTYIISDNERNIEFYRIKDDYKKIPNEKFLQENTDYYTKVAWNDIYNTNMEDNYYSIKAMENLEKINDYYKKEFDSYLINVEDGYNLRVFTNMSELGEYDFSNNAFLEYVNENDIRIYLGTSNKCSDNLEVLAHEYTHGYFNKITRKFDDNETNAVNEAYSDIMALIIEAYYNGEEKIDGVLCKGIEGLERDIKNSNLKLNNQNEEIEYHTASMILSKIAYQMSTSKKLDLNISELQKLWFNSLYKLPKYIVTFEDVEKAILIEAVELGYSKEDVKEISDIFIAQGYPDYYEECINNKVINANRQKKSVLYNNSKLTQQQAVELVKNKFGDWKEVKIDYEYIQTLEDEKENIYYAINAYANDNFINHGGEWLEKVSDGRYYAGTYYVCTSYLDNKVHVGYNPRDYNEYNINDVIQFFVMNYYIEVN